MDDFVAEIVRGLRSMGCKAVIVAVATQDSFGLHCTVTGDYEPDTHGASAITGLLRVVSDLDAVDFQALAEEKDKLWKIG